MPSIDWNKLVWGKNYNWDLFGEEWSAAWGSSEAQWHGTLLPRIHRFIPCKNMLEIACGYGRWSKFLIPHTSKKYRGIDIAPNCIEHCNKHLKSRKAKFIQNDGTSLKDVSSRKYDFIFSFDSLVHVDITVLEMYIEQIIPLLTKNGVCFIHHSNFGQITNFEHVNTDHPDYIHARDTTTSAKKVAELVEKHNGKLLLQELVSWGSENTIDCFTTFSRNESNYVATEIVIENKSLMNEAINAKNIFNNYCFDSL